MEKRKKVEPVVPIELKSIVDKKVQWQDPK
jgi:hypothetical protein